MAQDVHFLLVVIVFCAFAIGFPYGITSQEEIRETLPKKFQDHFTAPFATDAYAFERNVPRKTQRHYVVSQFSMAVGVLAMSGVLFDVPGPLVFIPFLIIGLTLLFSALKNLRRYRNAAPPYR